MNNWYLMFKNPADGQPSYIRRSSYEHIRAEQERIIRTLWPEWTAIYRER